MSLGYLSFFGLAPQRMRPKPWWAKDESQGVNSETETFWHEEARRNEARRTEARRNRC